MRIGDDRIPCIRQAWRLFFYLCSFVGLATQPVLAQDKFHFVDNHRAAGIVHTHRCAGDRPLLPRLMVAGMAILDYDNDGWLDIYMLNQGPVPTLGLVKSEIEPGISNRLYRNVGGTFVDVTESAQVGSGSFSLGVVAGDLDNDGDQDLIISNYGPAELFLNNGDGTFSKQSTAMGISGQTNPFGAGIALLDIDSDGALDLFLGNYVDFSMSRFESAIQSSFPYPPGPKDFPASKDQLFRNRRDGTLEDVTVSSNIARFPGPTMGVISGDWDDDGDPDLFLCSDAAPNQLFANDGHGRFTEQAVEMGLAFDVAGNVNGSMGVDAGDYDGDGKIDLLVTNYTGQVPVLYRNLGSGVFEDVTRQSRVGRSLLPHTNWGVSWNDFDLDGDLDAFIANGHFLKNIQEIDDRTTFKVANTLMENEGNQFKDASRYAGPAFSHVESSRGAAFGDLDNDGDIDGIVMNADAEPTYLCNETQTKGAWIAVELIGVMSNRDGVGAKVTVSADGKEFVSCVHAGRGYQSHYGTRLHFGLGERTKIGWIEVKWPSGHKERFRGGRVGSKVQLVEGHGQ